MKYCGLIGFGDTEETRPGIWEEVIKEYKYFGDVIRDTRRWNTTEYLNDNFNISNRISIVADPYAFDNFAHIRYAEWMGTRWKVTSVEVQPPRLILDIGGVYNGDETRITTET